MTTLNTNLNNQEDVYTIEILEPIHNPNGRNLLAVAQFIIENTKDLSPENLIQVLSDYAALANTTKCALVANGFRYLESGSTQQAYYHPLAASVIFKFSQDREDFLQQQEVFSLTAKYRVSEFFVPSLFTEDEFYYNNPPEQNPIDYTNCKDSYCTLQARAEEINLFNMPIPNDPSLENLLEEEEDLLERTLLERESIMLFLDHYGYENFKHKLLPFLYAFNCTDLHEGNMGLLNGRIVIFDLYSPMFQYTLDYFIRREAAESKKSLNLTAEIPKNTEKHQENIKKYQEIPRNTQIRIISHPNLPHRIFIAKFIVQ